MKVDEIAHNLNELHTMAPSLYFTKLAQSE